MSDQDRGAYTPPTDDRLAFDARAPQRRRAAPVTLIASAVILLGAVGAVVFFYQSGVRGANEPPQVVGKPVGAIKTAAPAEEAKPIEEQAALDVYVQDGAPAAAGAPTFAAEPEAPQPRPVAPSATVQAQALPPAQSPPKSPVTVVQQPVTAATSPALRPAQPVAAPKPAPAAPPAKAPATVETKPSASGGPAMVQIGAYTSTADADREFAKVRARFGKFTAGKGKRVEPVQKGATTLYRTAFTGFSKADAQAFCAAMKAARLDCMVK